MRKTMTPAAIAANRRNALKSTGPRTPEGKARASRNNLRHGLHSRELVIPSGPLAESRAQFEALRAAFHADLRPATAYEAELVDRMACCHWLARRVQRFEGNPVGSAYGDEQSLGRAVQTGNRTSAIGHPDACFYHPAFLAMVRFENRHDRIFHHAYTKLLALRAHSPVSAAPGLLPLKGDRGWHPLRAFVASSLRGFVAPSLRGLSAAQETSLNENKMTIRTHVDGSGLARSLRQDGIRIQSIAV